MGKGRGGMWSIGNGRVWGAAVANGGLEAAVATRRGSVVTPSGIVARCEDDPLRRSSGKKGTREAVGMAGGCLSGCCGLRLVRHHLVASS